MIRKIPLHRLNCFDVNTMKSVNEEFGKSYTVFSIIIIHFLLRRNQIIFSKGCFFKLLLLLLLTEYCLER